MIKTLQKHGNSHALVFDKTLMDLLDITPETPLNVRVEEGHMFVSRAMVGLGRTAVAEALERLHPHYEEMLQQLAGNDSAQ